MISKAQVRLATGLIVAEIGVGFRYLALIHLLGHACLRTLQFLVPDTIVHRGGCLIEGEHGSVDARIETQAGLIADALDQSIQR